jgi:hypothetical protein
MKHCLLSGDRLTRTGKECFSEKSTFFGTQRKQWHTRRSQSPLPISQAAANIAEG